MSRDEKKYYESGLIGLNSNNKRCNFFIIMIRSFIFISGRPTCILIITNCLKLYARRSKLTLL